MGTDFFIHCKMERRKKIFFFIFLQLEPNESDIKQFADVKISNQKSILIQEKRIIKKTQNSYTLKLQSLDLQFCQKIHS